MQWAASVDPGVATGVDEAEDGYAVVEQGVEAARFTVRINEWRVGGVAKCGQFVSPGVGRGIFERGVTRGEDDRGFDGLFMRQRRRGREQ